MASSQLGRGYGSYWLDSGDTVLSTGQTSLVVDPPSGRAPVKQSALDEKAWRLAHEGDTYLNMSVWDRCISRGIPGSMLPAGYNNAYRILQTPDHVVIYHEMIHDARIIPLSAQPFVDDRIRQWMGDARARWEDDVLVVETKNFHDRGWIASSGAGRRLKGIRVSDALSCRGAVPACLGVHHHVGGDDHRSERVHRPLEDLDAVDGRAHLRDVRVRLPRGKLRRTKRAQRSALSRQARGVGPRAVGSAALSTGLIR